MTVTTCHARERRAVRPLFDDLRLEGPGPVPGHVDPDRAAALGQDRLGPAAVADLPAALAEARGVVLLIAQVLAGGPLADRLTRSKPGSARMPDPGVVLTSGLPALPAVGSGAGKPWASTARLLHDGDHAAVSDHVVLCHAATECPHRTVPRPRRSRRRGSH